VNTASANQPFDACGMTPILQVYRTPHAPIFHHDWPIRLSTLFHNLTSAQREAVEHIDGPLLILAGPGSGKTRVVTHRIGHMIEQGIEARNILALTFTNKAADEMKSRVEALGDGEPVWISTFHRFCARLLRRHANLVGLEPGYSIYDSSDSKLALKRAIIDRDIELSHLKPERVAYEISWAKNNLITAENYQPRRGSELGTIVSVAYPAYQQVLRRANAVDFDDLLLYVALLLRENEHLRAELDERYRYVMVDEYQDTNLAQYAIARALSIDAPNLAVTGDPDQSIYGWRGANLSNILEFESDYPSVRVVFLEQNYRSTKSILRTASQLIAHNRKRKPKSLHTENAEGRPVSMTTYATYRREAEAIAQRIAQEVSLGNRRLREFAVFYRTNALSREIEHALRGEGVEYQMINGQAFYQRKEIKDVLAYLTLLHNPSDDQALLRIINTPTRAIGKKTIEAIRKFANRRGLTIFEAARQSGLIESLAKRSTLAVARFVSMIDRLSLLIVDPVEQVLGHVLDESGYRRLLADSDDADDQERLSNVQELLTAAREFDEDHPGEGQLEEFLEGVCLVNDTDAWEVGQDQVTLMTLHGSKGLEFPVVFVVALEQGILPHSRSSDDPDQLEEERRLLFVGITRAQEELHLSHAKVRDFRGERKLTVPSEFQMELPRDEMDVVVESAPVPAIEGFRPFDGRGISPHPPEFEDGDLTAADISQVPVSPASSSQTMETQPTGGLASQLTTAAGLAANRPARTGISPDVFVHGMRVMHPEYGRGRIVSLGGQGDFRKATVEFDQASRRRSFVLSMSSLRPA